ncbi:hypothetical protein KIN20_036489 [Parelaphostrongylus tenuis]|uniref:Uncharacterized protein n=1 Tax=Parelaphostrongylus tenuis TaxID=148309 RepID=A0AAD5WLP6_PARTN|nr:hypothetical protein KIN20_036489 [Parelaphostrongylus tenuis]
MANAEIECVIRDTKDLMLQISNGERRIDEMIRRVNTVTEKMACIREYQQSINAVNVYTVNGSRRTVLLEELQRENRQILAFHEENRNLREAIDESLETLTIVMARHRNVMARLERISKQPPFQDMTTLFLESADDDAKEKERFRRLIADVSDFMKQCEDTASNDLQNLSQLLHENRVLREMLSSAAISTPGVKRAFFDALAELKAEREQNMSNSVVNGADGDGDVDDTTDEELNKTVFEAPELRKD